MSTSRLPRYSPLECADKVEQTAASLVQLALDSIKGGKKKVKLEVEIEAKVSDDGKSIELEIEMKAKEDNKKDDKKMEYAIPRTPV